MKKIYLFLMALLFICIPINVCARGNITYTGSSKKFIHTNNEDIFENFKDVMPGDKITEQLIINNAASNNVKIKLYIRSLGATEETKDFLSKLNLNVDKVNDTNLFNAPAGEATSLTEWIYIGTIYSGGKVTLDITLEVPLELSNEYQDKVGYVNWQFKVEELPISPDDPKNPSTLDDIKFYLILGIVSLVSLMILIIILLKKNDKDDRETME